MPIYTVEFYAGEPGDNGFSNNGTFTYTGPEIFVGTAVITDNEPGIEGETLDDDTAGNESATADVTVGTDTSIGTGVHVEEVWLLRDSVTGEEFNASELQVSSGPAAGRYTLSERPLIAGRSYTVLDRDSNPDATDPGDPVFTYSEYVCFASGTRIATPGGERAVERHGVLTKDLLANNHSL